MAAVDKTSSDRSLPPDSPTHSIPIWIEVDLTGAELEATDEYLVYLLPENAYLEVGSLWVGLSGDPDDGTTLRLDFTLADSDGVADTVILDGIDTAGAAPLTGADAEPTLDAFVDCGGKYFVIEVATAAAGAAGNDTTFQIGFTITRQVTQVSVT